MATTASAESEAEAPSAARAEPPAEPVQPIAALPALELKDAAPNRDRFALLFRFDNLRKHGLAEAAESIIRPMPDYQRVFGAAEAAMHGDLIGNVFAAVFLTTADPRLLTATTLAAHGPFDPDKMKAMLSYPDSGIAWSRASGGALGSLSPTVRFADDPRVFLMPAPGWIILAHPENAPGLATPLTGKAKRATVDKSSWPAWLQTAEKTEAQSRIETPKLGDLLVSASIHSLGDVMVPTAFEQFDFRSPEAVTIAAFAADGGVMFQGSMQFASAAEAERFATLGKAFQSALKLEKIAAAMPPGSVEPLGKMRFYQAGTEVRWTTRATNAETEAMCAFSAVVARRMMGGQP